MISIKSFPLDIKVVPIKKEMAKTGTPAHELTFQLRCNGDALHKQPPEFQMRRLSLTELRLQFSS